MCIGSIPSLSAYVLMMTYHVFINNVVAEDVSVALLITTTSVLALLQLNPNFWCCVICKQNVITVSVYLYISTT